MREVMIDFETLGTVADAVILSIGAVKFNIDTGQIDDDGFYASISVDSNLAAGRRIQEDTLIWWMDQNAKAQNVFKEAKQDLLPALQEFHAWFDPDLIKEYKVWSNGADFDIPMIQHAWRTHGIESPWQFWNSRCFRTYKSLPHAKQAISVPNPGKHNALMDALTQAKQLIEIHKVVVASAKGKVKV